MKNSIIINTLKYSKVTIIKFDFGEVLSKFRTLLMKLTFYELYWIHLTSNTSYWNQCLYFLTQTMIGILYKIQKHVKHWHMCQFIECSVNINQVLSWETYVLKYMAFGPSFWFPLQIILLPRNTEEGISISRLNSIKSAKICCSPRGVRKAAAIEAPHCI